MSTELATLQIYSKSIDETLNPDICLNLARSINFLTAKFFECMAIKEKIAKNYVNDNSLNEMLLAANITEFNEQLERAPTWELLNSCGMKYNNKQIFVALTERITDKVSGVQLKLTKLKNIKKRQLSEKLNQCYENYLINEETIHNLENQIKAINDYEIRHLMQEKKMFENLNFEKPSKSFLELAKAIKKTTTFQTLKKMTVPTF
jgi:hypothetical protein